MQNDLTAAKILTQIGVIANSYNELSLANILATIMRKKGERKEPYYFTNQELMSRIISTKKELDNDEVFNTNPFNN
jgi:hypothetical protein